MLPRRYAELESIIYVMNFCIFMLKVTICISTCEIPLSVILRTPIEVWVSCGENFIRPETAEKLYESSLKAQMNRNADNLVLGTEKHTLRHMQGNYSSFVSA